jgi:hypothetical protein
MLQSIYPLFYALIHKLIQLVQPLIVPFCFTVTWLMVGLVIWSLWSNLRNGVEQVKQMHQIPCANCQFFTHSYHLKCPVHPTEALSDDAINCPDYDPYRI